MAKARIVLLSAPRGPEENHELHTVLLRADFEPVQCHEETFQGDVARAAKWMTGGQEISCILIEEHPPKLQEFIKQVIQATLSLATCPVIVVGQGANEGGLTYTGSTEPHAVLRVVNGRLRR